MSASPAASPAASTAAPPAVAGMRSSAARGAAGGARLAVPSRRRSAWLLAGVAFCLLWPFPSFELINNPNENVRVYMTMAMVEGGTYRIDAPWRRYGWVNDAAELRGHHYSVKAPLTSWLGAPAYALLRAGCRALGREPSRLEALWAMRFAASIVPWLLCLWALHGWLGRRTSSPVLRDATWLTLALGSLLYGYALLFVSHTLAAACGVGALMLLSEPDGVAAEAARASPRRPTLRAFAAGLLAAAVTAAEYPGVIASVALTALAAFALRDGGRRLAFVAGAALPTLGVMHFQWSAFGSPLRPGHLYLENKAFAAIHERGVFGADAFYPEAAGALLFDPGFGLFPLSPLLLPALVGAGLLLGPGAPWLLRRSGPGRAAAITAAALAVAGWLMTSFLSNWRGGWTIGPRYLAPFVPFVAWAALEAMERLLPRSQRAVEGFAVGALGVSLLASGWPSAFYPHLPEALVRPLPQLLVPLWQQGLVPRNAGHLLGLSGLWSMAPWVAAMACLFAVPLLAQSWPQLPLPLGRKLLLAGPIWTARLGVAGLVAAALATPLFAPPRAMDEAAVARDVAFIVRTWAPAPPPAPRSRPQR